MSQYLYDLASYNIIDEFIDEFHNKYDYKNILEQQKKYFHNLSNYTYHNQTIVTYTESLIRILNTNLLRLSSIIRMSLIKHKSHYKLLRKINQKIRCGFNMYKFRSKTKVNKLSINRIAIEDIKFEIASFLTDQDNVSFNIARTYNPENIKDILMKIPVKRISNSNYFSYFQYNYISECERIIKLASPRKSWNKKEIIKLLVDNADNIFYHFNKLPVEYTADMSDINPSINIHLYMSNKTLINTNYAKKSFKFHKALEIWETTKLQKKTIKTKNNNNKLI